MKDDYLWDGTGPPDPEIERLEATLGGLAARPAPLDLPDRAAQAARIAKPRADDALVGDALVGGALVGGALGGDAFVGDAFVGDAPEIGLRASEPAPRSPGDQEPDPTPVGVAGQDPALGAPVLHLRAARKLASTPWLWALAAALALALAGWVIAALWPPADPDLPVAQAPDPDAATPDPRPPRAAEGWEIARTAGAPTVGGAALGDLGRLGVGQWLETDQGSRAKVQIAQIGTLDVEGDTRLRLKATDDREHRLELAQGTIHARVLAPPRLFFVETPGATAVDLGCAYTLQVRPDGAGVLSVDSGYVALEGPDRVALVPAGASCRTRPLTGPGVPWFRDASPELISALDGVGLSWGDLDLDTILAESRPRDTLSLWHLLPDLPPAQRGLVFDRMVALAPEAHPPDLTREAVMRLDKAAVERWQEALVDLW